MTKQFGYKGKVIHTQEEPRTGVCNRCRKVTDDTVLHHVTYDDNNPRAHTIELCRSCHALAHYGEESSIDIEMYYKPVRIDKQTHKILTSLGQFGETYGDIVKRIAKHYASCPEIKKERK
jgi:hypothetical protein